MEVYNIANEGVVFDRVACKGLEARPCTNDGGRQVCNILRTRHETSLIVTCEMDSDGRCLKDVDIQNQWWQSLGRVESVADRDSSSIAVLFTIDGTEDCNITKYDTFHGYEGLLLAMELAISHIHSCS